MTVICPGEMLFVSDDAVGEWVKADALKAKTLECEEIGRKLEMIRNGLKGKLTNLGASADEFHLEPPAGWVLSGPPHEWRSLDDLCLKKKLPTGESIWVGFNNGGWRVGPDQEDEDHAWCWLALEILRRRCRERLLEALCLLEETARREAA